MKPLMVKCPQCHEVSELYLGSDAYMIVLNCPSCQAPLMYYYGKTLEIDQQEIDKIQGNMEVSSVQGMLRHIGSRESSKQPALPPAPTRLRLTGSGSTATHRVGESIRELHIHQDDITNLKISLAVAKDVNDFLSRL